jgi:hypothetical protein
MTDQLIRDRLSKRQFKILVGRLQQLNQLALHWTASDRRIPLSRRHALNPMKLMFIADVLDAMLLQVGRGQKKFGY